MHRVAGSLALLVLSGCLSPVTTSSIEPGLRLADLERCDYRYPDGRPVPCEDQAVPLKPVPRTRPDADVVCLGGLRGFGNGAPTVSLLYQTRENELHVDFDVPDAGADLDGVITIDDGQEVLLYAWHEGPIPAGRVAIEDPPRQGTFLIGLHETTFETNRTDLASGHVVQLWSVYDRTPWPLQRLDAANRQYFLQAAVQVTGGGTTGYSQVDGKWRGADFELETRHTLHVYGTLHYRLDRVDLGCTADRAAAAL